MKNPNKSWDDEYITEIERTEEALGYEICGVPNKDGEPCQRLAVGSNGRCEKHGGNNVRK